MWQGTAGARLTSMAYCWLPVEPCKMGRFGTGRLACACFVTVSLWFYCARGRNYALSAPLCCAVYCEYLQNSTLVPACRQATFANV